MAGELQRHWARMAVVALCGAVLAACVTPGGVMPESSPAARGSAQSALPPLGFLALCSRSPEACYDSSSAGDGVELAATARRLAQELGGRGSTSKPAALKARSTWGSDNWANFFRGADTVEKLVDQQPASVRPADLTPELWATLQEVNGLVNKRVISRSDRQIFGVADHWALPFERVGPPLGDCEDYVLQKRQLLILRGLSPSVLSIAIVRIAQNSTHAVLLVNTDGGLYVLDSLSAWILTSDTVTYTWLERQVAGEAFRWVFGAPTRS